MISASNPWIAFAKDKRIAIGSPRDVATQMKAYADTFADVSLQVLDARTSHPLEVDLRGTLDDVLGRLPPAETVTEPTVPTELTVRGPGRPKLGVVAREVTLLPRHWDWLATQPGGASVALRKIVEQAKRANVQADMRREATDSTYRFMHALAGHESTFVEASRALFAGNFTQFKAEVAAWPVDIRTHLLELARRIETIPAHEPAHLTP
jgi:hypothetical protein